MVVCVNVTPRSAIIWTRSRELSLKLRYQRTHSTMISRSKCRPLKRSGALNPMAIPAIIASHQKRIQSLHQNLPVHAGHLQIRDEELDIAGLILIGHPECL